MYPTSLAPNTLRSRLEGVRVRDLMTRGPVSVRHAATVREAGMFLTERGIGAAPVVDDAGRAVGVISRFDVLLAVNAGVEAAPVQDVMTPSVVAVCPHTPALDALDHMVRRAVRRVFVVDDGGIPIGVVSMTDLCRGRTAQWSETSGVPRTERRRGVRVMTGYHTAPPPPTAQDLMKETRVLIPAGSGVREAAAMLATAGDEAAPVIDSDGRCVGLFSAADYRRWATHPEARAEVVCDWQIVPPAAPDEVDYHMTRRYAVATPGAGIAELLPCLDQAPDPFLIVLDRQQRPRGLVSATDLLNAEPSARRVHRASVNFN